MRAPRHRSEAPAPEIRGALRHWSKLFLNLMRFGRQLEWRHPLFDRARLADEPEYSDDSHATREFRRFTALAPGAYVHQKSGGDRLIHTGASAILTA